MARFHLLVRAAASADGWHQARILGVALVAVGLLVTGLGLYQYQRVLHTLRTHGDDRQVSPRPTVAAASVTLIVLVALCVYLAAGVR